MKTDNTFVIDVNYYKPIQKLDNFEIFYYVDGGDEDNINNFIVDSDEDNINNFIVDNNDVLNNSEFIDGDDNDNINNFIVDNNDVLNNSEFIDGGDNEFDDNDVLNNSEFIDGGDNEFDDNDVLNNSEFIDGGDNEFDEDDYGDNIYDDTINNFIIDYNERLTDNDLDIERFTGGDLDSDNIYVERLTGNDLIDNGGTEFNVDKMFDLYIGGTDDAVEDMHQKLIPDKVGECSIINNNRDVCSSDSTINYVKSTLNISKSDPRDVIEEAKEKTGCKTERCVIKSDAVVNKDSVTISTEDHHKHSKIFTRIDCNKLYWYYISDTVMNNRDEIEICISISRNDIDDIFNSIDKTYDRVSLWINKDDVDSSINISLHHTTYDDDENVSITTKRYHNNIERPIVDINSYPIRFTLSTKVFKQRIEKMSKLFPKISIKKESKDTPLTFSASVQQGKNMEIIFNNNTKIGLIDNTNDDDIISIDVMSEYIVLLAKTTMGDFINIWIDNDKDIRFQMVLSDICFIEVFTETKDA
jgi:hypothetical protein